MYLKKMLFAVVGVAMLFSGIFHAAAQEITSKYVKFDKIPIIQSGHYYIFGLRNGIVEDLKKDMIYETHDPIKNS